MGWREVGRWAGGVGWGRGVFTGEKVLELGPSLSPYGGSCCHICVQRGLKRRVKRKGQEYEWVMFHVAAVTTILGVLIIAIL